MQAIDLPGESLAAGDYFVVCANAGETPSCDLDVSPDTNLIQNGAPNAIALRLAGTLVDVVSYEGDTLPPYVEGSGSALVDTALGAEGLSRCPDGSDTDRNNQDFLLRAITPGAANACPPMDLGACGDGLETRIHAIQGSGPVSPLAGTEQVIECAVVGIFPGASGLRGFFVQEEPGDADAAPETWDGFASVTRT